MGKKAFTIIELVGVMIVIGILSVIASAAISSVMSGIQLSGAAEKIASDLRYAQNMAGNAAVWCGVSFEVSPANRYTLYTTTGSVDSVISDPAKTQAGFIVDLNSNYNVAISAVNIAGGNKVEFSPLGTPYYDKIGTAISAEGVVTLSKSGSTRTIRITAATGRIYIQ